MKSHKLALPLLAAVTLLGTSAGVAYAQETGPNTEACTAAKTKVSDLEKDLGDAQFKERRGEEQKFKDAKKARDAAKATRDAAQKDLNDAIAKDPKPEYKGKRAALQAAEDALKVAKQAVEDAQEKRDNDSQKVVGLRAQVELAIQERDNACGTTTTTPTPTPTPEPENDVDCDEVDAAEAQRILDADRSDPNNLDQDKDGIACEVDEILPESNSDSADGGVTVNNNVAVPSGGIATGVGPRDS